MNSFLNDVCFVQILTYLTCVISKVAVFSINIKKRIKSHIKKRRNKIAQDWHILQFILWKITLIFIRLWWMTIMKRFTVDFEFLFSWMIFSTTFFFTSFRVCWAYCVGLECLYMLRFANLNKIDLIKVETFIRALSGYWKVYFERNSHPHYWI